MEKENVMIRMSSIYDYVEFQRFHALNYILTVDY